MSTDHWKLEKDLCRCCHSEGSFKVLSEPHRIGGEEEIYSEMLRHTIDVDLTPVEGPLCTATYTICETCIERLRDACNFKKQVLQCEKMFKDMYRKDFIKVAASGTNIKQEAPEPDDAMDEGRFDDSDEMDYNLVKCDEPPKVEIKEEKKPKARKAKPKAKKKKVVRSKKIKTEAGEPEEGGDGEPAEKKGYEKYYDKYTMNDAADGSTNFVCDTCKRIFKRLDCFKQHFRHVHLKLRPKLRSCCLCDVKVPGYMRAAHLEKEHGVPAPSCGACGKKFAYPYQVLRHQKEDHMGEKSYPCPMCPMVFASRSKLGQHSIKHSALRDYKCHFCNKAFKWKKNLKTHIMMHLDDRRHVCTVCSEAFVQQSSLKYHITKRHPELV